MSLSPVSGKDQVHAAQGQIQSWWNVVLSIKKVDPNFKANANQVKAAKALAEIAAIINKLLGASRIEKISELTLANLIKDARLTISQCQILHHDIHQTTTSIHQSLVALLDRYGELLDQHARYAEAITIFRECVIAAEIARDLKTRFIAQMNICLAMHKLASAYRKNREYDKALEISRQALEEFIKLEAEPRIKEVDLVASRKHLAFMTSYNLVKSLLASAESASKKNRLEEALQLYQQAFDESKKSKKIFSNLEEMHAAYERDVEEDFYRAHTSLANIFNAYATHLQAERSLDEALVYSEAAITQSRRALAKFHGRTEGIHLQNLKNSHSTKIEILKTYVTLAAEKKEFDAALLYGFKAMQMLDESLSETLKEPKGEFTVFENAYILKSVYQLSVLESTFLQNLQMLKDYMKTVEKHDPGYYIKVLHMFEEFKKESPALWKKLNLESVKKEVSNFKKNLLSEKSFLSSKLKKVEMKSSDQHSASPVPRKK